MNRWEVLSEIIKENNFTRGAELGVYDGRTLFYLLDNNPSLFMLAVDPWIGDIRGEYDPTFYETNLREVFKKLFERAEFYINRLIIIKSYNEITHKIIKDNCLDFIFIDANHSYQNCKQDIAFWTRKVRDGGLIMGHDFNYSEGVKQAVLEVADKDKITFFDDDVWCIKKSDIKPLQKFMIVSFYTKGTSYEKEVWNLINSLDNFGYEYDIQPREHLGSWQRNAQYKSNYIKEMLLKHKKPILWIDADGVVKDDLSFFNDLNCDIACYKFPDMFFDIFAATIYLNYTEKTLQLVDDWIEENKNYPEETWGDQRNLDKVIKRKTDISFYALPSKYAAIFDKPEHNPQEACIVHYQASRRFKQEVDNGNP